jgi:hypothetical protein
MLQRTNVLSCSNNPCYSYSGSACFESWQVAGLLWQVFAALFHKIREIQGSKLKTGHNVSILDKNHLIIMNSTSRKTPYMMVCDVVVSLLAALGFFHVTFEVDGTEALPPPPGFFGSLRLILTPSLPNLYCSRRCVIAVTRQRTVTSLVWRWGLHLTDRTIGW